MSIHEECGVFGIYDPNGGCARTAYYGLYALQHRGQEAAGIATINDRELSYHKDLGLVGDVFDDETLERLNGTMAVGHVRYATTGGGRRENAQPLTLKYVKGTLAVAHNGNLVNTPELRTGFEYKGAIFQTTTDSEIIAYAIAQERLRCPSVEEAVCRAMEGLRGAFSLIVMSPRKLVAARDPWGFRPLCMGRRGDAVVFASESCALDAVDAVYEREIEPGEIAVVEDGKVRFIRENCEGATSHMCIFEYIYFARPDSVICGQSVHEARLEAGRRPTWSSACRTPAWTLPWDTLRRRVFPTARVLSRTATLGGPLSPPTRRAGRMRSGSNWAPSKARWRASGW